MDRWFCSSDAPPEVTPLEVTPPEMPPPGNCYNWPFRFRPGSNYVCMKYNHLKLFNFILYIWPILIIKFPNYEDLTLGQICLSNCKIERPERILRKTFDEEKSISLVKQTISTASLGQMFSWSSERKANTLGITREKSWTGRQQRRSS